MDVKTDDGAPENTATPPPEQSTLGHRAMRGIAVTLGGQWSRTIIQTASTVLLARLLLPADFGLLAMVTAIVGVAELVREFGLSGAIVQAKELSDSVWRSLLWLSVAFGAVAMVIVAAISPLVALLYGDDRLVLLTLALSPGLFLNGVSMPLQTQLQRQLRFSTLASIDVVSMAVGVAASITGALLGFGVWSLVLLNGAGVVYRFIALWVAAKPKFGRPHIGREVRPFIATGGNIFGVLILNYASRNVDNIVVGRFLGATVLGQYTRAYALLMLPMQQLNGPLARVALPVLSQLQEDAERYRRYIRSALLVLSYVSLHVFAIAAALAAPLVSLLLGPNWDEAATLFTILAIAGVGQTLGNVLGWMYISLGKTRRQLIYFIITKPIVIASFFVGIFIGGIEGLAWLYGIVTIALLIPEVFWATHTTFVRPGDFFKPLARPLILVPFAFLASWSVATYVDLPDIVVLIIGGFAGLVPIALSLVIPAYRRDLGQLKAFVNRVRKPR